MGSTKHHIYHLGGSDMLPSAMSPLYSLLPEKQPCREGVSLGLTRFPERGRDPSEPQSFKHRNVDVGAWARMYLILIKPAPQRLLQQSAECQQLNLPSSLSPLAEGILPLIAPFHFQPPHTIIMTIGRWQISFHFPHDCNKKCSREPLSTKHRQLTSQDTATETCPLRMREGL